MTAGVGGSVVAGVLLSAAVLIWPGGIRAGPRRHVSGRHPGGRHPGGAWGRSAGSWLRSLRKKKTADGRALDVLEALATQVRAGASPDAAWRQALEVVFGPEDAAAGRGASASASASASDGPSAVDAALARDPAWRAVAAAWRMSEQTGAPLADVLDRLAVGLRQEAEVEAEVEASLAAPRATARLLAGLPLVGVALGELIGARPVAVLLGTPGGWACGLGGVLLAAAGQLWTRSLVDRVARAARVG